MTLLIRVSDLATSQDSNRLGDQHIAVYILNKESVKSLIVAVGTFTNKIRQSQLAVTALLTDKQPETNEVIEGYYRYLLAVRHKLDTSETGINLAFELAAAQYPILKRTDCI